MIGLKDGPPGTRVDLQGITSACVLGILITYSVFQDRGYDLIITSCLDGKHSRNSLHYLGEAFDCRIRHLPPSVDKVALRDEIQRRLGPHYDVVFENPGHSGEHYHIEHQERGPV